MTAWTAPPPRRAGPAADDAGDGAALPTADVGELARIAARRLRLLLPCLAIAGAIALAYLALAPSRYAATMSILVDPRERVPVGLDAQAMPQTPDIALVESEMSILTSRAVLRRVAEAQNLVDDPEFRPGLAGLLVGSLTSFWRAPASDPDARLDAVVVTLGDRISVKRSERSYIADVEVRAATPAKAEHLAQGLADAYFAEQAALSDRVVVKQSAWLDTRIAELQPRVQEAERRAQAYREANAIVLSDGRISPEQQLKDANDALVIARGKRGEVEAAYEQVKAALGAGGEGVGEAQHSPVIEKLRADQAALARDEAYELSTLGPRHPSYLTTRAQLQSVQTQIDAEVRRIRSASERDLKAARAAEQEAAKLVASLEATNQKFGGTRIELDRLNAEAAALRAAYEKSLSARENVRRDIVESPHSAIVDPPAAAPGRVSPRVWLALFLALVGALNLWLVAVFAAEYRDRRRGSVAAIPSAPPAPSATPTPAAAAISAPPGAEVKAGASTPEAPAPAADPFAINFAMPAFAPRSDGDSESDGGAALAAAEAAMAADVPYAAAINALRDRLIERLADGAHAPVVAIVSHNRGDGASTIALSLAHALSVTGRRVLLVDCDHRRPTLSAYARRLRKVIVDSPGKVASILRRDAVSGGEALILPLGGPGQAVLNARLHARFDWVILDCGPLAAADALLAHEKTADTAVIVDAATTDAAALEAAAERAGIRGLVAGVARTPAKQLGSTA